MMRLWPLASLTAIIVLPASGVADDLVPPPWRGGNGTWTVQEWDFTTPGIPSPPDGSTWGSGGSGFVNPFGTPLLAGAMAGWLPVFDPPPPGVGPRFGIYELPGPGTGLGFIVPNADHPQNFKDVWIQLSWWSDVPGIPPPDVMFDAGAGPVPLIPSGFMVMADGWFHSVYTLRYPTCPRIETIGVINGAGPPYWIDQIVIETICQPIPEPATIAGLGLGIGILALLRRKR